MVSISSTPLSLWFPPAKSSVALARLSISQKVTTTYAWQAPYWQSRLGSHSEGAAKMRRGLIGIQASVTFLANLHRAGTRVLLESLSGWRWRRRVLSNWEIGDKKMRIQSSRAPQQPPSDVNGISLEAWRSPATLTFQSHGSCVSLLERKSLSTLHFAATY